MQSKDIAANVFNSINLLAIKRSVRLLLDLETNVIEDFVKKYSAVVIFLLNVLDAGRSAQLLERLTDSSIIYLIEEELRFLIIREVAQSAADADRMLALTLFLEQVDTAKGHHQDEAASKEVLLVLMAARAAKKKPSLAYLEALPPERLKAVLRLLLERNRSACLAMMVYSSDPVLARAYDIAAAEDAAALAHIPAPLFLRRLRFDYSVLRRPQILEKLPGEAREVLGNLVQTEQSYVERMRATKPGTRSDHIELVHGLLRECLPELRELVLDDLVRKGELDDQAAHLLRAAAQGSAG